jgi:AraC-like DNA-binding protein
MEGRFRFRSTRGALVFSALPREGRRYLVLVEEGRCRLRGRPGVSCFRAPFVLAFSDVAASFLRMEEARGKCLSFDTPLAVEVSCRLDRDDASLLGEREPVFVRIDRAEAERYRILFEDIIKAWERASGGNPEAILTGLSGLLVRLRRSAAMPRRPDRSPLAADASAIETYLAERFRESLSLETMADELGYSPSYLSRYFKQKTGRCLFEYLNARRIAEACALLKATDKSVTEIAFEVGYNNLSFFNRYFRRLMDSSPQEYRKRARV